MQREVVQKLDRLQKTRQPFVFQIVANQQQHEVFVRIVKELPRLMSSGKPFVRCKAKGIDGIWDYGDVAPVEVGLEMARNKIRDGDKPNAPIPINHAF